MILDRQPSIEWFRWEWVEVSPTISSSEEALASYRKSPRRC